MPKDISDWYCSLKDYALPDVRTPIDCNPALVQLGETFYCFFTGNKGEGIYYTTTHFDEGDMRKWSRPILLTSPSVRSPAVARYKEKIYLFYHPTNSAKIYYHTFDGVKLSPASNIGMDADEATNSSPWATEYDKKLYVFWSGSGHDGVWYKTFDGSKWSPQTQIVVQNKFLSIAKDTSPSAVTYGKHLYVFYNGPRAGIYYSAFDGKSWTLATGLQETTGSSYLPGTSPSIFLYYGFLTVLWNGSGKDGTWMSCWNGSQWTRQESLSDALGGDELADGATAQGYSFGNKNIGYRPFIFRTCESNDVVMCDGHQPAEYSGFMAGAGSKK